MTLRRHTCPQGALDRFNAALGKGAPTHWGLIASPRMNQVTGETDISFDETSGHWILDNGEYAGPIFYCPWCRAELEA